MIRLKRCFGRLPCKISYRFASNQSSIVQNLEDIRNAFPDYKDLHARIQLALTPSRKIRVAVIPFRTHRTDISSVLDCVLADPLSSDQEWHVSFKNRLLAKNTLITNSSDSSTQILNHNSLVEFSVPFPQSLKRDVEILEVTSYSDSHEHLMDCHLHVFLAADLQQALTHALPSGFPSVLFVDLPTGAERESEPVLGFAELKDLVDVSKSPTIISSAIASKAVDLLLESPSNASKYLELIKASNIDSVKQVLSIDWNIAQLWLISSIIRSCDDILTNSQNASLDPTAHINGESAKLTKLREKWAEDAHYELQTVLTNSLQHWQTNTLPWWKLYYKVDDIYEDTSKMLRKSFLPQARPKLEYLLARVDSFASQLYLPQDNEVENDQALQADQVFVQTDEEIAKYLTELHNKGLRSVLQVFLGIQLPMVVFPILGVVLMNYSAYYMGSLTAFGVVVGFSRLEKQWTKLTSSFKDFITDKARSTIANGQLLVWNRWEKKILDKRQVAEKRKELIEELKKSAESQ